MKEQTKCNTIPDERQDGHAPDERKAAVSPGIPQESAGHGGEKPPTKGVQKSAPDPFDPEGLRLSQDFSDSLGIKKELLTVPVRRPAKEWWVRSHPSAEYRLETAVIELKEENETYLVAADLWPALAGESTFSPRLLVFSVNRQGVYFIWPIKLPGSDGRINEWSRSAMEAAEIARERWVRVQANMSLGAYEVTTTTADLLEPKWPDKTFAKILRIAFGNKFITDLQHPVLKQLRGES